MSVTPESVQQLLNSQDFGDRISGVNQLRQLDPAVAYELIKPMVTDPNTRVRYAAISQLDTLGTQDLATTLELLRDRLIYDSEPDVQAAAADSIGGLKLTEAYDDLANLYHRTSEWLVQFSIIATLGELGEPRSIELLQEALNSEIELVKATAVSALGELGDPRGLSLIIPFATDSDWQMRHRVAQALGRLGGTEAKAILIKLADDPFPQVAQEAQYHLQ